MRVIDYDKNLVDVSDIFNFFSARGGGRGSPRAPRGGGVGFLLKIPRGGGGVSRRGRGREGVCGELGIFGGGGAKYFFSGPKRPPRKILDGLIPNPAIDYTPEWLHK